jgi:hypothetical protein
MLTQHIFNQLVLAIILRSMHDRLTSTQGLYDEHLARDLMQVISLPFDALVVAPIDPDISYHAYVEEELPMSDDALLRKCPSFDADHFSIDLWVQSTTGV